MIKVTDLEFCYTEGGFSLRIPELAVDRGSTVALIGPSASCFPDPLFAHGVDIIGGSRVLDAHAAITRQRAGLGLGESARRYTLSRTTYPGTAALGVSTITP